MELTDELKFSFSRSSGKGGQHVNKVSTQVELRFNIDQSRFLTEEEKIKFKTKYTNRINANGEFILVENGSRSQLSNKKNVIKRFYMLLHAAMLVIKPRKASNVPKAVKRRILEKKRLKGQKKNLRKKINPRNLD